MYNRPRRGAYGSPASNVGRRRPQPQTNNFVSGGQLIPKQEPIIQLPYKRKQETQEQKPIVTTQPPQIPVTIASKPEPAVEVNLQKTADAILNKQNKVELLPPPPPVAPVVEPAKGESIPESTKEDDTQMDDSQDGAPPAKQQKMWHKRTKVPKAEKQRQNNIRLRKILQPRAAPMLLPEIFGKLKYNVEPANKDQQLFKAVVNVHGLAHEGVGATSKEAETAAAEAALKHIALAKLKAEKAALRKATAGETDPTVEKMEQDDDESTVNTEPEYNKTFSFEHLASFAMYKLLSSWDKESKPEEGSYLNLMSNANFDMGLSDSKKVPEFRASKKMPANPELMNPVMLLNQMHPEAVYEMICVTGSAHKVISFTMKCTLGNKAFVGHGSSKKAAKKKAAYEACKDVLNIVYPEENSDVNESMNSVASEVKPPIELN